ncbi:MAG: DHA2 family efflux MFS transporter permease subunit [Actinobacteria bacterium]|nr:DHA2 family efflux MFS transporter permease subunit [Actinomycetota bacterium]NBP54427.1 DHA2 family efflux MFS transporter permease subunit [Actinomycetota bacterium]
MTERSADTGKHRQPGGSVAFNERRSRVILGIAGLAALATYLDTTLLFVAFPDIKASFGDSPASTLSWVLNAYTIAFAALLVPAGKIADRLGHRRAFLIGSATFTIASMVCGLAPNVQLLIVARVAQGVGAAILVPSSLALVMAAFPRERLPQTIAIWGAIGASSSALGPSLGGLIVDTMGWRWAFFINLPVGIVTVVAGIRFLHESKSSSVRLPSPVGVILVALTAGALSYGVAGTSAVGWAGTRTIVLLVSGLVLLLFFIAHQRRTDAPTLNLELFSLRNFRWGNLAMFSFSLSFIAMFFGLILFLVNVWGWSVLKAGFGVAPGPAVAALLAPQFGKLAGRIGQRPLIAAGGLLFAASGVYRLLFLDGSVNYVVDFALPLALSAPAVGMVFPQVTSAAAQALPADRIGVGGATTQAIRQFGGSLGVAMAIAFVGKATVRDEVLAGFDRIWILVVAGGVATTLFSLALRRNSQ